MSNPQDELSTTMTADDMAFQDFLKAGPNGVSSSNPDLPPVPTAGNPPVLAEDGEVPSSLPHLQNQVDDERDKSTEDAEKEAEADRERIIRNNTFLPSEKEVARLKTKYHQLKVVPLPYDRADGMYQGYVLHPLTRSEWDQIIKSIEKIAANKPGVDPDLILAEKIVQRSLVWPNLREDLYAAQKAGLIPSLFAMVQQISLFFEPAALATMMFEL